LHSIAGCTIVAKNHLSLARVLARSFGAHHPGIPFYVLLADECDGYFTPEREPFELIPFSALSIPRSGSFRFRYAQQPLSYAATPYLLAHLLDRGVQRLLFFKQESLVLGSHAPVVDRLEDHPIVLTAHMLAPLTGPDRIARELNILQSGVFNVGLLGVANQPTARRFLRWWQDRVYTHCRHAVSDGMHYEQRWLDLVPSFFAGAHVLRDPGINVAHWNLPERAIEMRGDAVFADGVPCRLFRFSGYDHDAPHAPTRYSDRLSWAGIGPARGVFERYGRALDAEGYQETRHWPYAYGQFDNGVAIPEFVRHVYGQLGDVAADFGDPRGTGPGSFFAWLNEPVNGSGGAVTRLWHAVYEARVDLQHAFPDHCGVDRTRFAAWTASSGTREHGIPNEFLPPGIG
jgi:hypothetical protein